MKYRFFFRKHRNCLLPSIYQPGGGGGGGDSPNYNYEEQNNPFARSRNGNGTCFPFQSQMQRNCLCEAIWAENIFNYSPVQDTTINNDHPESQTHCPIKIVEEEDNAMSCSPSLHFEIALTSAADF